MVYDDKWVSNDVVIGKEFLLDFLRGSGRIVTQSKSCLMVHLMSIS